MKALRGRKSTGRDVLALPGISHTELRKRSGELSVGTPIVVVWSDGTDHGTWLGRVRKRVSGLPTRVDYDAEICDKCQNWHEAELRSTVGWDLPAAGVVYHNVQVLGHEPRIVPTCKGRSSTKGRRGQSSHPQRPWLTWSDVPSEAIAVTSGHPPSAQPVQTTSAEDDDAMLNDEAEPPRKSRRHDDSPGTAASCLESIRQHLDGIEKDVDSVMATAADIVNRCQLSVPDAMEGYWETVEEALELEKQLKQGISGLLPRLGELPKRLQQCKKLNLDKVFSYQSSIVSASLERCRATREDLSSTKIKYEQDLLGFHPGTEIYEALRTTIETIATELLKRDDDIAELTRRFDVLSEYVEEEEDDGQC